MCLITCFYIITTHYQLGITVDDKVRTVARKNKLAFSLSSPDLSNNIFKHFTVNKITFIKNRSIRHLLWTLRRVQCKLFKFRKNAIPFNEWITGFQQRLADFLKFCLIDIHSRKSRLEF